MPIHPIPGFFEPVNALLHLAAALVFAVLGVRLVARARALDALFLGVFALAAVLMLSMSGVYHMLTRPGAGAAVLFRLDKAAVFVLIAGTFTPIHAMLFHGVVRWGGLALMWAAAATGVTLVTIFFEHVPYGLGTTLYIALGWIGGISVVVLWRRRGFRYVAPILAGGLSYTIGAILLGLGWPTIIPGVFGPHELWHIAVIIGLGLHWRFIARLARESRVRAPRHES